MKINGLTALRQNDSRSVCRWKSLWDLNGMTEKTVIT